MRVEEDVADSAAFYNSEPFGRLFGRCLEFSGMLFRSAAATFVLVMVAVPRVGSAGYKAI
jgi:hypothetical protein